MYNIFGIKTKRTVVIEGEPPPKKLVSDGDLLIKELSKKQLDPETSLKEQLNVKQHFTKSTEISGLTEIVAGSNTLETFQSGLQRAEKKCLLQSAGLSTFDIQLLTDFKTHPETFQTKYKTIDESVLNDHLERIEQLLQDFNSKGKPENCNATTSRQQLEFIESVKPNSFETKTLSFRLKNKQAPNDIPRAIDDIASIEKEFLDDVGTFEKQNIDKIRKKARNLADKINSLDESIPEPPKPDRRVENLFVTSSNWDVKETVNEVKETKRYECKNQKFYTIVDGEIVEMDSNKCKKAELKKLSVEEIRSLPKFHNYESGTPSVKLYLKNVSSTASEDDLRKFLKKIPERDIVSIQLMKGRMKGQVFLEFTSVETCQVALDTLNGLCINGKPIIAQFGKSKG